MDAATVTRIKFCGITNLDDADAAVEAGAWALGMILWPGSKRRCRTADAAMIAATHRRRAELVGVFVNPTLDQVTVAADEIGLTMLQFHGDEGPSFCAEAGRRTGCRVIKAGRVRSRAEIQALAPFHTDFHLLDTFVEGVPGGTGETFAWELARSHGPTRLRVPVILAGGLTADNVVEAITTVRPYAVDVAGGTESAPGVKDHDKLRAFAAAVASTAPAEPAASAEAATPAETAAPAETVADSTATVADSTATVTEPAEAVAEPAETPAPAG
jgi:phosphoribosylanthranilate isomerase